MQVNHDDTADMKTNANGSWCLADAAVATAAALNVCEPSMTGKLVVAMCWDHSSNSVL